MIACHGPMQLGIYSSDGRSTYRPQQRQLNMWQKLSWYHRIIRYTIENLTPSEVIQAIHDDTLNH